MAGPMSTFDEILERSRRLRDESRVLRDEARMTREALAVIRAEAKIRKVEADLGRGPAPVRWRSNWWRQEMVPPSED